jgi:hypothetical protein
VRLSFAFLLFVEITCKAGNPFQTQDIKPWVCQIGLTPAPFKYVSLIPQSERISESEVKMETISQADVSEIARKSLNLA